MTQHIHHGVVIAGHGSAIVSVEHDDHGVRGQGADLVVTGIERLPFDLSAVVRRVHELPHDPNMDLFVIDGEGLGRALWTALGSPAHRGGWSLYTGRGFERQGLVDGLVVAVHADQLRFAAGLDEMPAMTEAMTSYRRKIREDGLLGSELVVALCLAVAPPRWGYGPPRVY